MPPKKATAAKAAGAKATAAASKKAAAAAAAAAAGKVPATTNGATAKKGAAIKTAGARKRKAAESEAEELTAAEESEAETKTRKTKAGAASKKKAEVIGAATDDEATKKPAARRGRPAKAVAAATDAESDAESEAEAPPAKKPAAKKGAAAAKTNKSTAANHEPGPEETKKPAAAKKSAAAAKKAAPAAKKGAAAKKTGAAAKRAAADAEKNAETENAKSTAAKTKKRKAEETEPEESEGESAPRPAKKTRTAAGAKHVEPKKATHPHKIGAVINKPPKNPLEVFVFGEGSGGELGLGAEKYDGTKKPIDVKRPRINHNLLPANAGVVQIACGGMHVVALTDKNTIVTWGVNDEGALGRDTTWDGGLRDMDAEDDDSDDEGSSLNPKESTPAEIDTSDVALGVVWAQVVASDSASFALTADGRVYGWGTFRSNDGILGFTEKVKVQRTPALVPSLKNICQLAAGSHHVLALDKTGLVFAWGSGQQNQLARRVVERNKKTALTPMHVGLKRALNIEKIACGSYHSFAINRDGRVYSWGLNNFAETGHHEDAGRDEAAILQPKVIRLLEDYKITGIDGGEHHSLACTDEGKLLSWGRIDGCQTGIAIKDFTEENAIFDEHNKPRILSVPTVVPGVENVTFVASGTDNSFAITKDGKAYSWGFSANYQTGQGTDDDVETPTLLDNTAVRDKKLTFAGAGGQYSILGSEVPREDKTGDTTESDEEMKNGEDPA